MRWNNRAQQATDFQSNYISNVSVYYAITKSIEFPVLLTAEPNDSNRNISRTQALLLDTLINKVGFAFGEIVRCFLF